ncbi:MAG: ATP-binding cassette domain-containing protein [Bifidobacteriaceae bacterium]|jgi:peptide/nickel transport system ATP-binding protein|nr:ATP-binding cassette domain-containing protein [Bifidobacteriaceae bacterium]
MAEPKIDPILVVKDLVKTFPMRGGKKGAAFTAVDKISFDIYPGQTWGLIGESGSGKTTTGRIILGLEKATSGVVYFDWHEITAYNQHRLRKLRSRMQIVFQDSGSAFNPRRRVGEQIGFPLKRFGLAEPKQIRSRVVAMMERVGLSEFQHDRYIHEFSGGQRQRLGIARALITDPEFVLLDEPTAALDVSVQAQVLNLLKDLQAERGLTMLLITHNLALVEHMCDYAGVLDSGRLVETGPVDQLLRAPQTAITQKLVDAVLEPELVETAA